MLKIVERILYPKYEKEIGLFDYLLLKSSFVKNSDEEIFNILSDCTNPDAVKYLISDSKKMLECYLLIKRQVNFSVDKYIMDVLKPLCKKESSYVIENIKNIENIHNRLEILLYIEDEYTRLLNIDLLKESICTVSGNYYQQTLINSIKDKRILEIVYDKVDIFSKYNIALNLSDEGKERVLCDYDIVNSKFNSYEYQIEIIRRMKDDRLKLKYAMMPQFRVQQLKIFRTIKDEEIIMDFFNSTNNVNLRIKIIAAAVNNKRLQRELVMLLKNNTAIEDAMISNYQKKKRNQSLEEIPVYEIDKDITFGVELECCGGEHQMFLDIETLLNNWKIKWDGSLPNDGIEVVSPILRNRSDNIGDIRFVCNLLRRSEFTTPECCGGHIHFGFNYFKTPMEFKTFLQFYAMVEDILLIICNKKGSLLRHSAEKYAKRFREVYVKRNSDFEEASRVNNAYTYGKIVKDAQNDRYYTLNLQNIGNINKNTIEFRAPNGEIDFEELMLNVQLFAKLMEKSKELSKILDSKKLNAEEERKLKIYKQISSEELGMDERFILFINMMFENEETRNEYIERYNCNRQERKKKFEKILCDIS